MSTQFRPIQILAIAGSLRRDSWNHRLLLAASEVAPAEVEVRSFEGHDAIPVFNEDLEVDAPPSVRDLRRRVEAADGLLIATPEYSQSVPGVLKNTLDWLSRPHGASCLQGKPVAVVGASTGPWGTRIAQKELRHVLWSIEASVLAGPPLYVGRVVSRFDNDGRLTHEGTRTGLERVLVALVQWIKAEGAVEQELAEG
jgi:chromate reductase